MGRKKIAILLTGSSGFIGRNIFEQLGDKYCLLAPRSSELDLTDYNQTQSFFQTHTIDFVIHAAVVGGSRKEEYQENSLKRNLQMFMNIIRNRKHYKKLIHLGSGAEYDKCRSLVKVKESEFDKKVPSDEYGFYKYLCSKYIEELKDCTNLRIFGIFGKYENYRFRFISNAICRNLLGLPITINQNVYFDYIYINDFVKILEFLIKNPVKEISYNIGTGSKIDLLTIARKINSLSTYKSEIIISNSGQNLEYTSDVSLVKAELGNFTFMKFDDALLDLFLWYKKHMDTLGLRKHISEL